MDGSGRTCQLRGKEGRHVDRIAETAGIPVGELLWANQIEYPYRLAVGQALYISDGEIGEGRRPLFSSGYAYPLLTAGYWRILCLI